MTDSNAARAVAAFNAKYAIGAPFWAYKGVIGENPIACTLRAPAEVMGGHTAVAWLNGVAGCISLTHLKERAEEVVPVKPNRRQLAKARTAARVLEAAKTLFETHGYTATTIRGIAKEAGMSTGAVFANYEDKDQLYEAIYGHPPITPELGRKAMALLRRVDLEMVDLPAVVDDEIGVLLTETGYVDQPAGAE